MLIIVHVAFLARYRPNRQSSGPARKSAQIAYIYVNPHFAMASTRKKTAFEVQEEQKSARRKNGYRAGLIITPVLSMSGFALALHEINSPTNVIPNKFIGKFFYFFGGSSGLVVLDVFIGIFFLMVAHWLYKRGPK